MAAGSGGGLFLTTGTASLTDSTVSGNNVKVGNGSGIAVTASTLTVTGSTLSANQAHGTGANGLGGAVNVNASTDTFTNSTLAGNTADNSGGGIYSLASTVNLDSSTMAGNSAPIAAGLLIPGSVTVNVRRTILSNTGPNCSGTVTSQGYNIENAATCALGATGDRPNTNPTLLPLANNGGPTQTMALAPTSPAIDAGDPACPPPATDQRGVARPQGPRCDIGAFEFVPPLPPAPPLPAPPATGRSGIA